MWHAGRHFIVCWSWCGNNSAVMSIRHRDCFTVYEGEVLLSPSGRWFSRGFLSHLHRLRKVHRLSQSCRTHAVASAPPYLPAATADIILNPISNGTPPLTSRFVFNKSARVTPTYFRGPQKGNISLSRWPDLARPKPRWQQPGRLHIYCWFIGMMQRTK